MSVFELFRGFFGVPGGRYRGGDRSREPFFEGLTREEDDDDEEDDEAADGFVHDHFDDVLRFGFSFGPNGMRIQEPQLFGRILQDMEEMLGSIGSIGSIGQDLSGIEAPPQRPAEGSSRRAGGRENPLRDFMLRKPDASVAPRDAEPSSPAGPGAPRNPFRQWRPFSRFEDAWSDGQRQRKEEKKEDGDLDSRVSSEGLDQILTPAPSQPRTRSFFQSLTVTKVVKPDGTVEERRTVRDGEGNEETTVTRSGGSGVQGGPGDDGVSPSAGAPEPFSDMHDELSTFSKFFGGFR